MIELLARHDQLLLIHRRDGHGRLIDGVRLCRNAHLRPPQFTIYALLALRSIDVRPVWIAFFGLAAIELYAADAAH